MELEFEVVDCVPTEWGFKATGKLPCGFGMVFLKASKVPGEKVRVKLGLEVVNGFLKAKLKEVR